MDLILLLLTVLNLALGLAGGLHMPCLFAAAVCLGIYWSRRWRRARDRQAARELALTIEYDLAAYNAIAGWVEASVPTADVTEAESVELVIHGRPRLVKVNASCPTCGRRHELTLEPYDQVVNVSCACGDTYELTATVKLCRPPAAPSLN